MITFCRCLVTMVAALLMAGCSSSASSDGASATSPTSAAKTSTTPRTTPSASAFCLDLETFQVGIVVFRGDLVEAARGKPLDFTDLKKRAAYIAFIGKQMQPSAPPDIAQQFRAVLKAIKTAASRLRPGAKVRDILSPLFGDRINPAFDAVDKYKCH